jgi:predicted PurR-regulated permease PerM
MQKRLGVTSTGLVIALLVGWEWLGVVGIVLALPTTAVLAAIDEAVGLVPKESGKAARSGIYPNDDSNYRS